MSKPMHPEIKALRATWRALESLDETARQRAVEWLFARLNNTSQAEVRRAMRFGLRDGQERAEPND